MPITPEQQARMAAARAAAIVSTKPTTKPGSERTKLRVGDHVEVVAGRTAGREGRVAQLNRQRFPTGVTYVEIGVVFTKSNARSWYRADELRHVTV